MPSPFPGMDPYLEDPTVWPGVHANLAVAIQELLNQKIRPKYVARVEERVYLASEDDDPRELPRIPDVRIDERSQSDGVRALRSNGALAIVEPVIVRASDPIRERRVEILDVATRSVVAVIEILSPSNKASGSAGRDSFLEKRKEILASKANWVEIDLLREGKPTRPRNRFRACQYVVYSSPTTMRPDWKARPIQLDDPLPVVGIPLRDPDPDAPLDLQEAITLAYDRGAYGDTTDYTRDPVPPLTPELAKWANKLLKQKKLR